MNILRFLVVVTITVFYALLVVTFINLYSADVTYSYAQDNLSKVSVSSLIKAATASIIANPQEPAYYRGRARLYLTASAGEDRTTIKKLKELARMDLENALRLNPHNLATIRNALPLYYFLAISDLAQPLSMENIDSEYLNITEKFFTQVKKDYPNDVGVFVVVAKYEERLGLQDNYNVSIARIRELRPDLLEWHPDLLE